MRAQALPRIVAVLGRDDYGPSDGQGSTSCPHCGAAGRYVYRFLLEDGRKGAAMAGCIKLFPTAPEARLVQEALTRQAEAARDGKRLATWWADMVAATQALEAGNMTPSAFACRVQQVEQVRQAWLRRNGFGRRH